MVTKTLGDMIGLHTHTHTQHSFKNMRRKVEGYEKSKNYNKTSICAIRLKT